MKVTEFFVGFGPRIWSFRRGETEYGIKAIPLGGYCRIIGMTQPRGGRPRGRAPHVPVRELRQPAQGRSCAGVTVHFADRVRPDLHRHRRRRRRVATGRARRARRSRRHSAAAAAGSKAGDTIVAINGTQITNWDQVAGHHREAHGGKQLRPRRRPRNGQPVDSHRDAATDGQRRGRRSASRPEHRSARVGFFEAIPECFNTMGRSITGTGQAVEHVGPMCLAV